MNWSEWAQPALIFEPQITISKAMSGMSAKKSEISVVTSNGKPNGQYLGLLWAKDIVKRKIDDANKMTIKKFIRPINPVAPETSLNDIVNAILINDYPAIPLAGKNLLVLKKIDLLRAIRSEPSLIKRKAADAMKVPFCATDTDSIATVMSMIRDTGVERIVIVDKEGRLFGLADEIDLFRAQSTDRFRSGGGPVSTGAGEVAGEKVNMRQVTISGFVQKSIPTVKSEWPIPKVIDSMFDKNMPAAVVVENEKPVGIITTKPILRLIGKPVEGVLVQVSGIQPEDIFMKAVIDEQIVKAVQKWGKFVPIKHIAIHIDRYEKSGEGVKYSIKARVIGYKGMWFANDFSWDITKAMRGVLSKLEKEMLRSKEKKEKRARGDVNHFTEMGTRGPL